MINRDELAGAIAEKAGCYKYEAENFIDAFKEVMTEYLIAGETINIRNLFRVSVKDYSGRIGRCPYTGEPLEIPTCKKVRFKVSKNLNKAVNGDETDSNEDD